MVRVYSDVAAYAAAGQAVLLTVGSPKLKPFKLLEIRVPSNLTLNTVVRFTVNGETRYDIVPSINDHAYVINEDFLEDTEIMATVITRTAGAQVVGVSMVIDEAV